MPERYFLCGSPILNGLFCGYISDVQISINNKNFDAATFAAHFYGQNVRFSL